MTRARDWPKLGVSVLIGILAALTTWTLDIPGGGTWIVACWILGAVAAAIWPSWASFAACLAGIGLATLVLVNAGGQYAGLAWLAVAAEAALLGHGFLVSATVGRARQLRSLRDARVGLGILAAVGVPVVLALIAGDLAGNPP